MLAQNHRNAQADIAYAIVAIYQRGNREDAVFVSKDAANDSHQGQTNGKTGGSFFLYDLIGRIFDLVEYVFPFVLWAILLTYTRVLTK